MKFSFMYNRDLILNYVPLLIMKSNCGNTCILLAYMIYHKIATIFSYLISDSLLEYLPPVEQILKLLCYRNLICLSLTMFITTG